MSDALVQLLNLKGPVPTGFRPKSSPYLATAAGETGARPDEETLFRKLMCGRLKRTVTVESSTMSVPSYGPSCPIAESDFVFGSAIRSKANLTAWALNGVPSWNPTPWRSLKVNDLAPSVVSQEVASPGSNLPGSGWTTRLSKMWRIT